MPTGEDVEIAEAGRESAVLASVKRRLLHGSMWVLGGRVATILLGLLLNGILARLLSPTEMGAYFTTFTLVLVGSTVAQLGLDRTVVRFVSASLAVGRPGEARDVVRVVFTYGVLGAVGIGLVLGLGLGHWFARSIIHSDLVAGVIPIACGWLIVTALQGLMVETFRGLQRFDLATIFDVLLVDILAASTFGALFLLRKHPSLDHVILVFVVVTLITATVAGTLLLGRLRRLDGHGRVSRREIFAVSWPLLVTNLAILLLGSGVDIWVLGAFRSQREVAFYGAASRLTVFVAAPYIVFMGVIPPIISELHAQGRKRELEETARTGATVAGAPGFVVLMIFLLFGPLVMASVFGRPFYRQGAPVLAILSASRIFIIWTGPCGVALMMTGHQQVMMRLTLFSGVVSVGAGILAAPHFGPIGVAVATGGAQVLQNSLQLLLAKRRLGVWTHAQLSPRALSRFLFAKDGGPVPGDAG